MVHVVAKMAYGVLGYVRPSVCKKYELAYELIIEVGIHKKSIYNNCEN